MDAKARQKERQREAMVRLRSIRRALGVCALCEQESGRFSRCLACRLHVQERKRQRLERTV
jgi:hypothetical protein